MIRQVFKEGKGPGSNLDDVDSGITCDFHLLIDKLLMPKLQRDQCTNPDRIVRA